jgi:BirA family biotin operon repressor/biotin-[acetyl-CoA-carboxylase] ligase
MTPDPLDRHRLRRALAGQPIGHTLVFLDETTSTNDEAASLARQGFPEGTVVFAESQSAGRGRRGSRWEAPARHDLLLSVLLRPAMPPPLWCRLTHLCALALHRAVASASGVEAQIKWPNDLLVGGRKLAGILVEASPSYRGGFAVAGIGLNVNSLAEHFPPELRPTATSLRMASGGAPLSREPVVGSLLRALAGLYPSALGDSGFAPALAEIASHSALLGRAVTAQVDGQTLTGTAHSLGPNGELVLAPLPPDPSPPRVLTHADLIRPSDSDLPGREQ